MTKWDRALTVALLLSAVLSFMAVPGIVGARTSGDFVEVKAAGQPRRVSLNRSAYLDIKGRGGRCRLQVKSSRARIVESNCPNQLCVAQGWVGPGGSIVCLPHEIVVTVGAARAQNVDAMVR